MHTYGAAEAEAEARNQLHVICQILYDICENLSDSAGIHKKFVRFYMTRFFIVIQNLTNWLFLAGFSKISDLPKNRLNLFLSES